jgi:sugar lactone lactonase YvrE
VDDQDGLAAADGRVWVTSVKAGSVIGIDPTSLRVVARISAPTGQLPIQVIAGGGGLWAIAATEGKARLLVMDPTARGDADGSLITETRMADAPRLGLVFCNGAAWVDGGRAGLLRIDPGGTQAVFTWGEAHGGGLDCAAGSLWEILDGRVVQLAVDKGAVTVTSKVEVPGEGPVGLAGSSDSLWVMTDTGSTSLHLYEPDPSRPSTVVRIDAQDPETGPSRSVEVGLLPAWLAASGDRAWVLHFDGGLDAMKWTAG